MLFGGNGTCGGVDSGVLGGSSEFGGALARFGSGFAGNVMGERYCSGKKVAFDELVDETERGGFTRGNGLTLGAHFDCFGETDKAWQALRSTGSGNDAELHFRLANLRGG